MKSMSLLEKTKREGDRPKKQLICLNPVLSDWPIVIDCPVPRDAAGHLDAGEATAASTGFVEPKGEREGDKKKKEKTIYTIPERLSGRWNGTAHGFFDRAYVQTRWNLPSFVGGGPRDGAWPVRPQDMHTTATWAVFLLEASDTPEKKVFHGERIMRQALQTCLKPSEKRAPLTAGET